MPVSSTKERKKDGSKSESPVSPIAYALLTNLTRRPPGANVVMEELVEALHSSKTAIRAAFTELSEAGYLSYNQVS